MLNKDFAGFRKIAYHLYQLIFANIPAQGGRIIISPGDNYFPFEALITDNSSSAPAYFLFDHAVSYTYAVRYLANDFGASKGGPAGGFLGVAPVRYAAGLELAELSGSDLSVQRITSSFTHSMLLLGQNASKHNFLRNFSRFRIIQLYTHASDSSNRKRARDLF